MNDMCYTEEILNFDDPIFRTFSTSYIITMHKSSRRKQYMRQIRKYRPTARVVVLHNYGFRACKKPSWVCGTSLDLWHANQTIASRETGDEPVLIMEDDCEFLPQLREWAARIETFLVSDHCVEAYSLGSNPFISLPVDKHHTRMYIGGSAHAVIYSAVARKKMIQAGKPTKYAKNHDTWLFSKLKTYISRIPLAVQTHPMTANSKEWAPIPYFVYAPIIRALKADSDGTFLYTYSHTFGRVGGLICPLIISKIVLVVTIAKLRQ